MSTWRASRPQSPFGGRVNDVPSISPTCRRCGVAVAQQPGDPGDLCEVCLRLIFPEVRRAQEAQARALLVDERFLAPDARGAAFEAAMAKLQLQDLTFVELQAKLRDTYIGPLRADPGVPAESAPAPQPPRATFEEKPRRRLIRLDD